MDIQNGHLPGQLEYSVGELSHPSVVLLLRKWAFALCITPSPGQGMPGSPVGFNFPEISWHCLLFIGIYTAISFCCLFCCGVEVSVGHRWPVCFSRFHRACRPLQLAALTLFAVGSPGAPSGAATRWRKLTFQPQLHSYRKAGKGLEACPCWV